MKHSAVAYISSPSPSPVLFFFPHFFLHHWLSTSCSMAVWRKYAFRMQEISVGMVSSNVKNEGITLCIGVIFLGIPSMAINMVKLCRYTAPEGSLALQLQAFQPDSNFDELLIWCSAALLNNALPKILMWKQLSKDAAKMKLSQRRFKQMCFVFQNYATIQIYFTPAPLSFTAHWSFCPPRRRGWAASCQLSMSYLLVCNTVGLLRSKIIRNSQSTCWALCGTSLHNNWELFCFLAEQSRWQRRCWQIGLPSCSTNFSR